MEKRKKLLPGIVVSMLLLCAGSVFLFALNQTQMFPTVYMLIFGALLAAVVAGIFMMVRNKARKRRFLGGICLASVLMGFYAFGMFTVHGLMDTLNGITQVGPEIAEIKVYVTMKNKADSLQQAADYTYGILLTLDRENTDKAIAEIQKELESEIAIREYDSPTELIDGLERGEVGAIIINTAFLVLLEEQEGYTNVMERIREISSKHIETEVSSKPEENVPLPKNGVYTIYITGIDTRGSSLNVKSRSDVNLIATVNTNTKEVLLLNTPRDYFVPLSISRGQPDKLTHAGLYGVNVCVDTLEMLYGINIDYYFRVNFGGFVEIIDALGGIDVYNPTPFSRHGYTFKKGMNHVDGGGALAFARERYAYVDGDIQRGKNQIEVVRAVIEKMTTSTAMLTNFSSLMKGVEGSFETTVPYSVIASVVSKQLKDMDSWRIHNYTVTGTSAYRIPYSMSSKQFVWLPNNKSVNEAKSMMETIRNGGSLDRQEDNTTSNNSKK